MTKALKIEAVFDGVYASESQYVIVPKDINGVLFPKLEIGETVEEEVWMGELEGKHSECYGDLTVTEVDLGKLSKFELNDLFESSNPSYLLDYFTDHEILASHENPGSPDDKAYSEIVEKYGLQDCKFGKVKVVINCFKSLVESTMGRSKVREIKILEEDYEKVIEMLQKAQISYE